jgi:CheY-like chemotaxis protein
MKFLFIDDNTEWLCAIEAALKKSGDVVIARCGSVGQASSAMLQHKPDVVFFDHHLTDFGDEGYGIAEIAQKKGIKAYSTTSDSRVAAEYAKMGIATICKTSPLGDFRKIIDEHLAA